MESRIEENPWKHKARVQFIGFSDVILAVIGTAYATYRMFFFYYDLKDQEVAPFMKGTGHVPFYLFVWAVVVLFYVFQTAASFVLYSAINQEATETDPYVSVQKCHCWLRCARLILLVVVIKLCLAPVIIVIGNIHCGYGICLGIVELVFRSAGIFGVKLFIQELQ